jgi:hypothetical protein
MTDPSRDPIERLLELAGPRRAPADDHYSRARQAVHTAWQTEVRRTRRARAAWTAGVSLAAAALLVLAIVSRQPAAPAPDTIVGRHNGMPIRLGSVLRTEPAVRTALQLANGTEIRMDVNGEIAFDDVGAIALRRGALFIDTGSAEGPDRAIEIRTPLGIVQDIGTRFEVRLFDLPAKAGSHDRLRTRVRDGIVRVTTATTMESGERGTELVALADGAIRRAATSLSGPDWDWVTLAAPPFDLDGKTLAAFLTWVAREGGWDVRFENDTLAASASTITINGSVEGLTPEEALRSVLATCGLSHQTDGNVVTITGGAS